MNPVSVKFDDVIYFANKGVMPGDGAYCFEFHATNSFNAIVPNQVA